MRTASLILLSLSLIACFPEDPATAEPDAAPVAPVECPHTQEGCAGCGLEGRSCCQRDEAPQFYCLDGLTCGGPTGCFRYGNHTPPTSMTGRELAYRLYNSMCEHERICGRGDGECGAELTVQFCEAHDCDLSLLMDLGALGACTDLAISWSCESQTDHHPPCVLELLALVPGL